MSGQAPQTPVTIDTSDVPTNAAAGTITPLTMEVLVDSLSALPVGNIQTSSYTFVAGDRGTLVEYNSTSAGTFTAPANTMQVGSVVVFRSINTGQLTIAAGSGFTLSVPSTLNNTPVQWATGCVHFTSSTTGVLM